MKRSNKAVVFLLTIIFLCISCFGQNEKEEKQSRIGSNFTSLQKSLLIPGWGQIEEKRYIEGIIFLSAEIFSIYKILKLDHTGNYYYDRYKKADNVDDAVKYRELTEKYDTKRNKFILVAAGIWTINLIDMYLITNKKEKKKEKLKLKVTCNENKNLALTISYSF